MLWRVLRAAVTAVDEFYWAAMTDTIDHNAIALIPMPQRWVNSLTRFYIWYSHAARTVLDNAANY